MKVVKHGYNCVILLYFFCLHAIQAMIALNPTMQLEKRCVVVWHISARHQPNKLVGILQQVTMEGNLKKVNFLLIQDSSVFILSHNFSFFLLHSQK
jgi:hypothetical protein